MVSEVNQNQQKRSRRIRKIIVTPLVGCSLNIRSENFDCNFDSPASCRDKEKNMAVQGVLPPKFTPGTQNMGQLAALWKEYKDELELYFLASGQDAIDDKQKVSLLLYQYIKWGNSTQRCLKMN